MTTPDLSIVIVSWNTSAMTRDCLRSIAETEFGRRAQTIVVDNASTDGSPDDIAREFPWVELIRNPTNAGFAAANNVGFRRCTGRHVLLLNSDTLVLGDVLEKSVRYLDERKDVGAMGCRVVNPDRTLQSTCFRYPSLLNLTLLSTGLHRIPLPFFGRHTYRGWKRDTERDVEVITGCYLLIRKEVLDEIGPLDERFFFCGEETDWCLRIVRAGHRLTLAPVGDIVHFGNASGRQLSFRRDVMLSAGLVKLHAKHGGTLGGAAAWAILYGCNAVRAIGWKVLSVLSRNERHRARAEHFANVTKAFEGSWIRPVPNEPKAPEKPAHA
ncbi:MAG: glycosyltransferase family 2 protein [Phycisphaerae bacterium]|nr:glycosyltransferase family 2 protein [Phycisphaerae bacterium]